MANNTNRPTISTLTPGGAFETGVGTTFASATGAAGQDGRGIMSAVVTDGMLTLNLTDGTTQGPFDVAGPMGDDGDPGAAGAPGAPGAAGANGTGISSIVDNGDSTITINYDDGTAPLVVTIPTVEGPEGPAGPAGTPGTPGAAGAEGDGFTGGTYDAATGVVTFTSDDGIGFSTGDLRGDDGAAGAQGDVGPAGPDGNAVDSLRVVSGGTVLGEETVIEFLVDGTALVPQVTIQPGQRGTAGAPANLGDFTVPSDTATPVLDTDIASMEYVDTEIADLDLATQFAAKQDSNHIVANATERNAIVPTTLSNGTIIIEEDTGEIYYIAGDGATRSLHATDVALTREVFGSLDVTTDPSRIDTLESNVTNNTEDLVTLEGNISGFNTRITDNETEISTIRADFVGESVLVGDQAGTDQISQQGAASDDYEVYTRRRVEERFSAFTTSPFRVLSGDPATFTEGDVWYDDVLDAIRYATSSSTVETVATESGAGIASITGPIATADGGLMYTATRFDTTSISWTTGSTGTTPTPGTAQFSVSATPPTIVRDALSTSTETVTVSLGVSGTGFSYRGFQNAAVTSDNGVTYSVSTDSGGATVTSFTSAIGLDDAAGIITFTGEILYNEGATAQTPHPFTVSVRLIEAALQDHILIGFDSDPDFDPTVLGDYTEDTGVVAADGARFLLSVPNGHTSSDMVYFSIPSSLNGPDNSGNGFYGSFGQYIADDDDGWNQADNVAFSLSGRDVYVISGFDGQNIRLTLEVF